MIRNLTAPVTRGMFLRMLADYVSRKIGTPGTRKSQLITQAQVKF